MPGSRWTGVVLSDGSDDAELDGESAKLDGDARLEIREGMVAIACRGLTRLAVIEIAKVSGQR